MSEMAGERRGSDGGAAEERQGTATADGGETATACGRDARGPSTAAADGGETARTGAGGAQRHAAAPGTATADGDGGDAVWAGKRLALECLIAQVGIDDRRAEIIRAKVLRGHREHGDAMLDVGACREQEIADLIGYGVFSVLRDGTVSPAEGAFCSFVLDVWDILDEMRGDGGDGTAGERRGSDGGAAEERQGTADGDGGDLTP